MSHANYHGPSVETTHNLAPYFVEHRQVAWVLLVATLRMGSGFIVIDR